MIKLVKNELYKIFHKKNILVFFLAIFAFMFLITYIMTQNYYEYSVYNVSENEILAYEEYTESINKDDIEAYASAMTDLCIIKLRNENQTKWAYDYLNDNRINIFDYYYEYYSAEKSSYYSELEELFNQINQNVISDNWEEYVENQILINETLINDLEKSITDDTKDDELNSIKVQIEYYEYINKLHYYRLNEDVAYKNDYLNEALIGAADFKYQLLYSENEDNSYNEGMFLKYEYIIDNKVDALETNNFKGSMMNFLTNYVQFIILFVLVIAGTILSSEITGGTIKTLLISPNSRTKVLISKFITIVIMSFVTIIAMLLLQLVLSTVFYGINDLSIPVLTYNASINELQIEHVFIYLGKQILAYIPTLMILSLIALTTTIIVSNSAIAIVGTFMVYIFSELVNSLIIMYDIEILKYLITLNWDFTTYLNGGISPFEYISLGFSILIYIIYFILISLLAVKLFSKKNISNV